MLIKIDKRLCDMPDLSDYALSCYCVILMISGETGQQTCLISRDIISYRLIGTISPPRRFAEKIKDGIKELLKKNIISKVESSKEYHVIDTSKYRSEYSVGVYSEEIQKIFSLNVMDKFALLKYFITLIDSFKSSVRIPDNGIRPKEKVAGSYITRKLSSVTGISAPVILKYNKILEENNLIYIVRPKSFVVDKSGKAGHLPNIYGRPVDKVAIEEYAEQCINIGKAYDWREYRNIDSDEKRRLTGRYNRIAAGHDEDYSPEDIAEIYAHIVSENKRITDYEARNRIKCPHGKIRDLDVFKKYDFIKFVDT